MAEENPTMTRVLHVRIPNSLSKKLDRLVVARRKLGHDCDRSELVRSLIAKQREPKETKK